MHVKGITVIAIDLSVDMLLSSQLGSHQHSSCINSPRADVPPSNVEGGQATPPSDCDEVLNQSYEGAWKFEDSIRLVCPIHPFSGSVRIIRQTIMMITLECVVDRLTRIPDLMLEIMSTFSSLVTGLKDISIREVVLPGNTKILEEFRGVPDSRIRVGRYEQNEVRDERHDSKRYGKSSNELQIQHNMLQDEAYDEELVQ
ncbi:hypothetical protein BD769DRAFT_1640349 [Suillus cothurnatus]|nr:hypothetical protein BD769DRAFT_1640349 [Suillus cothurnatus]